MYAGFIEEGDNCPKCHKGVMVWPKTVNCSCHINPPCSACTDKVLTCKECGHEDDPPLFNDVLVTPGLYIREGKPRPLDPTKIDFRSKMHTASTMIREGVYPESATIKDVLEKVKGTFGGRFESFGDGKFKFIAYTD